ncbi:potassium-transporting ATPase subunit F [Metabacillus crassostreae]
MIALFGVVVIVTGYLFYVLLNPEKF